MTPSTDRMDNPEFQAFLKARRIVSITGDGPYIIESQSGATYRADLVWGVDRYSGSLEGKWNCNCPARQTCRHIDAIVDMRWAEAKAAEEFDFMDAMERESI